MNVEALNKLLLDLHVKSRGMSHDVFRPWAFRQLQTLIAFDSAFWYRWALTDDTDGTNLHAWYLFEQPETLIEEFVSRRLWTEDVLFHRVSAAPPGTAATASFHEYQSPVMKDFLTRNRQMQLLSIGHYDRVPQIAHGVALYRSDINAPFTVEDKQAMELVSAHLVDVWRENWMSDLMAPINAARGYNVFSVAVLMPDFVMTEAQENLADLMCQEWPDWQGPNLPPQLFAHAILRSKAPFIGRAVAVFFMQVAGGAHLMQLRKRHPADGLAPRKREVATMFAAGASQTEVARRTGLSTSTVNNYLGEVYRDLEVHDKAELALLIARLQP
jgi:DNA-binding CsgD family transcriptional regulator